MNFHITWGFESFSVPCKQKAVELQQTKVTVV
jgi:hypothetical protein